LEAGFVGAIRCRRISSSKRSNFLRLVVVVIKLALLFVVMLMVAVHHGMWNILV
jgi:hypothetical protein